jgi:DNA polymerase III epsilon subunit-like protein
MAMILDLETTGLPARAGLPFGVSPPYSIVHKYDTCRIVQMSYMLCDSVYENTTMRDFIVKPSGFRIPNSTFHGITDEIAEERGVLFDEIIKQFVADLEHVGTIIAHNAEFDINVLKSELYRRGMHDTILLIETKKVICSMNTMKYTMNMKNAYGIKPPSLEDLYLYATGKILTNAHNSKYDVINLHEALRSLYNRKIVHIM